MSTFAIKKIALRIAQALESCFGNCSNHLAVRKKYKFGAEFFFWEKEKYDTDVPRRQLSWTNIMLQSPSRRSRR